MSSDNYSTLAHFTWCAQIALRLAVQEGKAGSALQQHMFLMQWLTLAQKQKRFSKETARDITWFLEHGQKNGHGARLPEKLAHVYHSCRDVGLQSDLFRLTYLIETARGRGWQSHLQSDKEWLKSIFPAGSGPYIYLLRSQLDTCFTDAGQLTSTLQVRVSHEATPEMMALFAEFHLLAVVSASPGLFTVVDVIRAAVESSYCDIFR